MESQPTVGEIEKSIHAAAMAGEKCDARDAVAVIGSKTLQIELLQSQIDRMRFSTGVTGNQWWTIPPAPEKKK